MVSPPAGDSAARHASRPTRGRSDWRSRRRIRAFLNRAAGAAPMTFTEFRNIRIHERTDPGTIICEYDLHGVVRLLSRIGRPAPGPQHPRAPPGYHPCPRQLRVRTRILVAEPVNAGPGSAPDSAPARLPPDTAAAPPRRHRVAAAVPAMPVRSSRMTHLERTGAAASEAGGLDSDLQCAVEYIKSSLTQRGPSG